MICPNCGWKLPDDSVFCQYCGAKVSGMAEQAAPAEARVAPEAPASQGLWPIAADSALVDAQEKARTPKTASTAKRASPKWVAAVVCLSVLLLGALGLNGYQALAARTAAQDAEAEIAELSETIAQLHAAVEQKDAQISNRDAQISSRDAQITTLNDTIASLEDTADAYHTVINAVKVGRLGYAADHFRASESILIVDRNEKNRKFTLTAHWPDGGTVSVDYNTRSPAAKVEFDQDTWSESTPMTIQPKHPGVTIVTFSNDATRQTFDVVIIVQ